LLAFIPGPRGGAKKGERKGKKSKTKKHAKHEKNAQKIAPAKLQETNTSQPTEIPGVKRKSRGRVGRDR